MTEERVRWKSGQPRRLSVSDPLPHDSQLAFVTCILCDERLGTVDSTRLIVVESPTVPHAKLWHDAPVARVHEPCVSGLSDEILDLILTNTSSE